MKNLDHAVRAFASAQRQRHNGAHLARLDAAKLDHARIADAFRHDQGFAVLQHPAGHAFAHLHAQVAQLGLLAARGNGIVELLGGLVEHEQRPQLCLHDTLHLLQNGAQNRVKIEA